MSDELRWAKIAGEPGDGGNVQNAYGSAESGEYVFWPTSILTPLVASGSASWSDAPPAPPAAEDAPPPEGPPAAEGKDDGAPDGKGKRGGRG